VGKLTVSYLIKPGENIHAKFWSEDKMVRTRLFNQRLGFRTSCLLAIISMSCSMSFAASLSVDSVVDAINNQKILAAGSRMSVQIDKEHVTVSTYRQTKETDKTNKIQAIFIAKAIMDLSPSVTRVSVYFFDSASSLSKYKQINVTSGDIKAYEGDQLTQDQLLSSIEIKDGQLADESSRISNYVGSRRQSYQVEASLHDNEVLLRTYLEGATPPEELKYQALKLAAEALTAASSENVQTLRVDFIDPTDSSIREVVFQPQSVSELRGKVSAILGAIPIVAKKADVTNITVVEGVSKEQRLELLERIKTLSSNGVGVTSFLTLFKSIEQDVPSGDSVKVGAGIEKLSNALAQQEQASKDAKNRPVTKVPEKIKVVSSAPVGHLVEPRDATRWALGGGPILLSRVVSDPDGYITEIESRFPGGGKADDDPKFAKAVLYFWKALQANNRTDDAARFQQRYSAIIAKHPAFLKL
jgi:hypothetical protein